MNGRQKFLGRFDGEQEAAQELFGVYTKIELQGGWLGAPLMKRC